MLLPVPAVAHPAADTSTTASSAVTPGRISGGSFQIRNLGTSECMTLAGGVSTDNNVELVQFDCDNDPSRRWQVVNWNGNSYQLVNVETGLCATVAGGSGGDNKPLVQFTCDSDNSRRWVLRLAGSVGG
ncbi:RICIN domain-containing protein [Streptomyces sp. NPDC094032]|uniref:RICIN domain-containing protein n=1 Tax=Streptomyces sp. NPDC094032 TaxID=3155308 RepID=UPI00332EB225